jgi:hypothetical protein
MKQIVARVKTNACVKPRIMRSLKRIALKSKQVVIEFLRWETNVTTNREAVSLFTHSIDGGSVHPEGTLRLIVTCVATYPIWSPTIVY